MFLILIATESFINFTKMKANCLVCVGVARLGQGSTHDEGAV